LSKVTISKYTGIETRGSGGLIKYGPKLSMALRGDTAAFHKIIDLASH